MTMPQENAFFSLMTFRKNKINGCSCFCCRLFEWAFAVVALSSFSTSNAEASQIIEFHHIYEACIEFRLWSFKKYL